VPDDALEGLPRFALRAPGGDPAELLRRLQLTILRHPVAAQAAFAALIAEGRRFARTTAGAAWQRSLTRSPLLRRARAPWDAATLWMLEDGTPNVLPSGFVDALCTVAQGVDLEAVVDRLMRGLLEEVGDATA
jgi:hypothetical protein